MARRPSYTVELRKRAKDHSQWPEFATPGVLERLEKLAIRALERRSPEGSLSGIIIYHQLTEQMARLLIADAQFLTQLVLYPARITFREQRRQTFGMVMEQLTWAMEFPRKANFIRKARMINELRNDMAHALVQRGSLAGMAAAGRRAQSLHEQAFEQFDEAHDWFRASFGNQRDRIIDW